MNRLHVLHFKTKEKGLKFVFDDEHEWWDKDIKLNVEEGEHNFKEYQKGQLIEEFDLNCDWNSRMEYSLPDTIAASADST